MEVTTLFNSLGFQIVKSPAHRAGFPGVILINLVGETGVEPAVRPPHPLGGVPARRSASLCRSGFAQADVSARRCGKSHSLFVVTPSGRLTNSPACQESFLTRHDGTLLVPMEVCYQDALVAGVSPWFFFKLSNTPIERKICRFLKLMNSVLKAQLPYLLRHLFRIRRFLISPPSPLRWGKEVMGVDIVDIPPTLIFPLRGGRKLFFLTQLG